MTPCAGMPLLNEESALRCIEGACIGGRRGGRSEKSDRGAVWPEIRESFASQLAWVWDERPEAILWASF